MAVQSVDAPQGGLRTLIRSYGSIRKAAEALGISLSTLYRKMKESGAEAS